MEKAWSCSLKRKYLFKLSYNAAVTSAFVFTKVAVDM